MRLAYPLRANECKSYSHKIKNYRALTLADKKILVNNFKEFYKYIFYLQNLPHPTVSQLYMAKFLSQSKDSKKPLMLQAQRGLAKSLTLQIFTVWLLLRNKNEKIVVVSATSARAESFTKFCLTLIRTIPLLMHLAPNGDDRTSTKKFDVSGRIPDDSPSMCAFGVTSAKTGSRATFIIYDDVEIPENSDTAGKREKLLEGVRDTANLGVAGEYRESCICTPQSSESVYNTMVAEDGFIRTVIPAEYPENIEVYGGDLATFISRAIKRDSNIIGQATDKRNNMAHLMTQKVKGKARYKLHYMLDTALSDIERYPLKLSDLIVMDLESDTAPISIVYSSEKKDTLYDIKHKGFRGDFLYKPRYVSDDKRKQYEGVAMFIDPSGRGKDETAYAISAQLGGKIFILDFGGVSGGYEDDTLITLSELAKTYKVNSITIESNFGDGSFHQLLKPHLKRVYKYGKEQGCEVIDKRATTNKEKRIIGTLEPVMMQHRLIINKSSLIRDSEKKSEYSFTYQLTHVTEEKGCLVHDDIIDVIEMAVYHWQESLARDTTKMEEKYRVEELEKQIKELELKRKRNSQSQKGSSVMSKFSRR